MSTDIDSKLILGKWFSDIDMDIRDDLDSGELDYASTYYDSPRSGWFVGIELPYSWDINRLDELRSLCEDSIPRLDKLIGTGSKLTAIHHVS